MRTLFVTRHAGARDWARRQGIDATLVEHLDIRSIEPGDVVLGTLPVHIASDICALGGRYVHLVMTIPPGKRGHDLTADEMEAFGARLQEYIVKGVHR